VQVLRHRLVGSAQTLPQPDSFMAGADVAANCVGPNYEHELAVARAT
jgi:hypothetical protein